ncbi:hypothetical protein F4780DRAFT_495335 [Xylariomycetidae sp. FL0641]|nr:hypothetical protein F4780DRAFT_495335 [Xylariomycetidae sp. FL0641]
MVGSHMYGRSCKVCVKVKCRCVPRQEGQKCERCHRLNKECLPSNSVYRSRRQCHDQASAVSTPARSKYHPASPAPYLLGRGAVSAGWTPSRLFPCPGEPSISQAEEYFARFRTMMLPSFPVFHLPDSMTFQKLREEKPFLWICVMCVASTSTSQQQVLGESIRGIIGREMIAKCEKNIDLLQGILVFLAWIHCQVFYVNFGTYLNQLAMSLVYDLGLDQNTQAPIGSVVLAEVTSNMPPRVRAPMPPVQLSMTNEHRRAVLGCFLVSSKTSSFVNVLKRGSSLKWAPDMDRILSTLSDNPEWSGDAILATQVKLALLIDQLNKSHSTWPYGTSIYTSDTAELREAPNPCHLDAFLTKLHNIELQLTPELANNTLVMSQVYTVKLLLNEAYLANPRHGTHTIDFARVEKSKQAVEAIRAWADLFFTMTPTSFCTIPFYIKGAMTYTLLTLARFSTHEDPAWDRLAVTRTVDVRWVCDQWARYYEIGGAELEEGNFFSESSLLMRYMEKKWKRDIDMFTPDASSNQAVAPPNLDDAMLQSMFASEWEDPKFLIGSLWP